MTLQESAPMRIFRGIPVAPVSMNADALQQLGDSAVARFDGFLSSRGGELLERKARLTEDLVAIHARQARKRRLHFFDGVFGDLADGSGDRRVGQLQQIVMAWPGGPLK